MKEPQRIAKLLARAGVASRREIERMIEERRIALDGSRSKPRRRSSPASGASRSTASPSPPPSRRGCSSITSRTGLLTAERDMKGRATIYDKLPRDLPRVVPVGRLDLNTEGLLLLTTDGELKRRLELPRDRPSPAAIARASMAALRRRSSRS